MDTYRAVALIVVPPSGGSLEIGNRVLARQSQEQSIHVVPPSGGSLEIGNFFLSHKGRIVCVVPPSGGSLEIGNRHEETRNVRYGESGSPFGGIPRNWKLPR